MITKEIRNEILEKGSAQQIYLNSDYNSGYKLFELATRYKLEEFSMYKKFVLTVGDIVLGFYKIEDTVPLLQQELELDPKTAALLGAYVLEFLAPLSDPNWAPPLETEEDTIDEFSERVENNQDTQLPLTNINPSLPEESLGTNNTVSQNFTIPANLKPQAIPELRTMSADMVRSPERNTFEPVSSDNTPTYISNQETRTVAPAPSYNAPLYEAPKPAPLEPPRWG